jgi:phosphoglycolate phosphatase
VKAIIFDLDGTLVDNTDLAVAAARDGLCDYYHARGGEAVEPDREVIRSLVGLPAPQYFAGLLPEEERTTANCAEIQAKVQEREEQRLAAGEGRMFPGVPEVMERLIKSGYRIGLASNCLAGYLKGNLNYVVDRNWFQVALCLSDQSSKVGNVALALDALECEAGFMVGDRRGDMEAGKANQLLTIGALYGYCTHDELLSADYELHDIKELPDLITNIP